MSSDGAAEPPEDEGEEGESELTDEEKIDQYVDWGRKGLAALLITIVVVVLLLSASSLPPDSEIVPGLNNSSVTPPDEPMTISIVSTNASVLSYNETGVVRVEANDSNETYQQQMAWVDTVGRDFDRDQLNVSTSCYERVVADTDAYVNDTIIGANAFVFGYGPNASDSLELFVGENGTSVSGKLLNKGYAVPSQGASAAYNRTAVDAQSRDVGIWACVPEEEEPMYNTTET